MTADRTGSPPVASGDPILVVDDEPAVRAFFLRALRGAGFETLEAADGQEALDIVERHPVSLVLLDSRMPRLDGPSVIRALRARPATRTLPVILVTANAEPEDRVRGLEAGADDYLTKPVALDELEARVHAQLRSHAAWIEAFEREAAQRRGMTAALRKVRNDGSRERVAHDLVEELMPVLGLEALALAILAPDGTVVPLATGGSWAGRYRPGHALDADLARRLRDATANGPWVLERQASDAAETASGGTIVALRLEGADGPVGLLALRLPQRADGSADLARRMPLFLELADVTAAVLGPGLETREVKAQARAMLEGIIARRAFTPHFQPIVSLADRAIVAYEALTRFHDGVPPDTRFAEAGRLGVVHELERATLAAAVEAAIVLLPADARLGLNVSPAFVLHAPDLSDLLAKAGRGVVLEITEHAPVDDYAALRAALARIEPPIEVSVDDAGSGYASLRHILALRPSYVKLDIGWIRGIDADPARQALVAGLVHFAAAVNCTLVGEGIETEAEKSTLLGLGVTLGQGYLFGKPAQARATLGSVRRS